MLKKILTACAGVVLSSGICLAVDINGVYSGSSNGQNVTVMLASEGGMVHGKVAVGSGAFPMVGRENNGQIEGIWQSPDGQNVPFVAAVGPNGLQIQTNGMTYSLSKGQQNQAPPSVNQQNEQPSAPVNAGPAEGNFDASQLEIRQGQSLQCAVPAGWSFSSTNNGVDTASPDGSAQMSHVFLRGVGRSSPEMFFRQAVQGWARFGISDVQIVSAKDLNAQSNVYELNFSQHGHPMHGCVQCSVQQSYGGYMAEMVVIQSTPEQFDRVKPLLIAMAKSVRVTDANAFVDNGKLNAEIVKRNQIVAQTQQEIGDMIINGERTRSAARDRMNLGASDTLRDQTRWTDADGNQYTAPLQAVRTFRNADGTVTYSTSTGTPTPAGATELNAFNYRGQ